MQIFRKKYLYNPQNPIYQSQKVKTYNCLNTETKDNRLAIIHHLKDPPFVQPSQGILQPIQIPTMSQPFSVYPLVYCVSEIGKVSQPDGMYILKSLLQCKLKNPLYYVLSPQGVCASQIEGLLPNKSPSIFNIALQLLDIPQNLMEVQKSIISKEGYNICRNIRDGETNLASMNIYGWKDVKKQKQMIKDSQYWVFKARRKQEGPLNQQYGLAWHLKHGLCRVKAIDLTKDSYETQFYKDFTDKVLYFQQNTNNRINVIQIHKCVKENNSIKIFTQIPNQGTLLDYITKKHAENKTLTQKNFQNYLESFIEMMQIINSQGKIKGYTALHIKNIYVHNNRLILGQPMLITDRVEKKLRQLKNSLDYFAPQLKENIILPENLFKLDFQKIDIWAFGFVLHKILTREVPLFDPTRKPILSKGNLSSGMYDLIMRCLSLTPSARPSWKDINLKSIQQSIVIEEVNQISNQREQIILHSPKLKSRMNSSSHSKKFLVQEDIELSSPIKLQKIEQKQDIEEKYVAPMPIQLSSRLKKVKLVTKIILIMVLYIFVFFRPFLGNSIDILLVRSYYSTVSLHLIDNSNTRLSTSTIITHDSKFFLLNDISFADVQNTYRCISDNFDPQYNQSYSLLTYIHSSSFLAWLLTGWLMFIIICSTKAIAIWKGGIGNIPTKSVFRHWVVYGFFEICMAALLFAHFYIYHFFFFSSASPCLSIANFSGIEPFFDSSLYLLLSNTDGYFRQVFSTLGLLSILILISACFYSWAPKLDNKYILSVLSVIFRIIPLVLLLLICRVGVFYLFSPTAINDDTSMLPAVVFGSVIGFFGFIPQVFIIICVAVQSILQLFFYWCEGKAAESDRLAKFFNIRKKKVANEEEDPFNNNSMLDNSKHKLTQYD